VSISAPVAAAEEAVIFPEAMSANVSSSVVRVTAGSRPGRHEAGLSHRQA
jgi:hypothetical protein